MKTCLLILLLAGFSLHSRAAEWKLVWSDEFDQPGLPDPAKWNYEHGYIANNEAQYYTVARPENARVTNGMLVIEARKELMTNTTANPNNPSGRPQVFQYTSARLNTRGKFSLTYGRIEARLRPPSARGTWVSFWTLGTNIGEAHWPACGEIDIMEMVGFNPGIIEAHIHTTAYNHAINTSKGGTAIVLDAVHAFHVYAVEWDPQEMNFFVDDQKYFTFKNEGTGAATWPFDRGQYILLNLAVGGDWGGQKGIDDNSFPQQFLIDYVRVYQREEPQLAK